jgi:hypothetical protein
MIKDIKTLDDIDIKDLEHWWAIDVFIKEQMEQLPLLQTYHQWRSAHPEGIVVSARQYDKSTIH